MPSKCPRRCVGVIASQPFSASGCLRKAAFRIGGGSISPSSVSSSRSEQYDESGNKHNHYHFHCGWHASFAFMVAMAPWFSLFTVWPIGPYRSPRDSSNRFTAAGASCSTRSFPPFTWACCGFSACISGFLPAGDVHCLVSGINRATGSFTATTDFQPDETQSAPMSRKIAPLEIALVIALFALTNLVSAFRQKQNTYDEGLAWERPYFTMAGEFAARAHRSRGPLRLPSRDAVHGLSLISPGNLVRGFRIFNTTGSFITSASCFSFGCKDGSRIGRCASCWSRFS